MGDAAAAHGEKHLLDESVERLPFPKLVLSGCQRRWPDCYASIRAFLGLPSA